MRSLWRQNGDRRFVVSVTDTGKGKPATCVIIHHMRPLIWFDLHSKNIPSTDAAIYDCRNGSKRFDMQVDCLVQNLSAGAGEMEKNITEKDLIDNGFTEKNISRLKEVLSRQENTDESFTTLIKDLSKRFYAGVICLILLLVLFAFAFAFYPASVILSYIPVVIIGVAIVYYVIPLNLSWKAWKLMKGSK